MDQKEFCEKYRIYHYDIDEQGRINTSYSVSLSDLGLEELPVKFGIVNGSFNISNNNLTNLKGLPEIVDGVLSVNSNKLTSLEGCPKKVKYDMYLHENELTDLEHFPKRANGSVYLRDNKLTSLKGCARKVNGDFILYNNKNLTSLKYGPQSVTGDYNAISCGIRTLESIPNNLKSDWLPLYENPVFEIIGSNKYDDLMTFKSCKVIRNDKIVLNRLKLYLNIIGALSKPKLDLILSDVKDLYEIV
tara:strand:+ start:2195 stop:2932 length:738 start_codon:yes stop_codon:yes gene_type:complete